LGFRVYIDERECYFTVHHLSLFASLHRRSQDRIRGPLLQPICSRRFSRGLTGDQQPISRHMMRQFLRDFLAHAG
jgi:hypothetical protein